MQKILEVAHIKLASVATDLTGKSGREMLQALVTGTTDAEVMADLARERMRKKLHQLIQALTGEMGPHQRFMLAQQLVHIDALDETIVYLDAEIV